MAKRNGSHDVIKAVKFAKSLPNIFTGETDNFKQEPTLKLNPECQTILPVRGIDPDCPDKMYRIVSVHVTGKMFGVAPQDQKEGVPSRFRPVPELFPFIPDELGQAVNYLQRI